VEARVTDTDRVLDIPAISYSEVEQQQRERAEAVKTPPKRRASNPPKRAARSKARSGQAPTPKVGTGEIGPAVVAAVEAKIAEGLNASQAFEVVAKERGMKVGAVSANYYRVKRNQSRVTKTPSTRKSSAPREDQGRVSPRSVTSPGARRRSVAPGEVLDVDGVMGELVSGVQALIQAVKEQGTEVSELRARLVRR
jgi:hypothetical protein